METISEEVKNFFNSGDPEARSWFLIRNNYLPFILPTLYVIFSTVVGPAIMKNRKPFELRKIMIVFNFFLVFSYVGLIVHFFWMLPKVDRFEFCRKAVIQKDTVNYQLATNFWFLYLLKYIEYFDTAFFILRKKENLVTFLHVFHHTVVPIIGWIMFRTESNGVQSIPIYINAIVHVLMYTYYGLAAMGPEYKRYLWWKKYLTQLQMIQFVFIVVFAVIIVPLSGCRMPTSSYVMTILFAPLFFFLFYNFYKNTFREKSASPNGVDVKYSVTNGATVCNGQYKNGIQNGRVKKEE